MNRLISIVMSLLLTSLLCQGASPKVDRIDPPYWWTGMQQDTVQLLVYGPDIASSTPSLDYPGVSIAEQVRLDNPDYLFLYLRVSDQAQPGTMKLTFTHGKKKTVVPYELKARTMKPEEYVGFDASDVLYLIMPDRFARSASSPSDTERSKGLKHPTTDNRANLHARHGGDIAGMREHLDYIDSLGVTAVWVNPVLENDMPGGSYHGYATTDYYRIDPRFGTNDEWREFIADAHKRGIKVVMDMIFNHSGSEHPFNLNRPSTDWINFPDEYVETNHRLSTQYDPYRSDYDYKRAVDGWFVRSMPDLNQRNPHLMRYLIQNSIWWIEDSKIDGIRMDTHPYADLEAMAGWIKDVEREYPNFNITGECWYANEGSEAFWQKNSYTNHRANPELPTVMDFVVMQKGREAFNTETTPYNGGLHAIYDHLALDYLFPDPQHILTFLDNHDTDRFLDKQPENLDSWKQALTFLLTTRGIPQIYYGTEILMSGTRAEGGDGNVRRDFPGGFPGDTINAFTREGRTDLQNEAFDFLSNLLQWRRGNEAISKGSLKHFLPQNGMYVYERKHGDKQVVVILNGTDQELDVDMARYAEILSNGDVRRDVITGATVTITPEMHFAPRAVMVLEK